MAGLRRHRRRRDDPVRRRGHARSTRTRTTLQVATQQDHAGRRRRRAPGHAAVRARHRRHDGAPERHRSSRSATSRCAPPSTRSAPTATSACPASCRTPAPTRTPSSSPSTRPSRPAPPTSSFTKPVTTYVDNFLGFEAGTIVPAAYYDEGKGAWVPSENGLVIKIVAEGGGRATVDADGDGRPADDDVGIDDAERPKLAQQYDAGKSLWRVEVKHFTPWDYNWPYGCRAQCDAAEAGSAAPAAVLPRVPGRRLDHRRLQPDARREAVRPGHAVRPLLQLRPRARLQGGLPARDPAHRADDPAAAAPRRARGDRRRQEFRQTFDAPSRT